MALCCWSKPIMGIPLRPCMWKQESPLGQELDTANSYDVQLHLLNISKEVKSLASPW